MEVTRLREDLKLCTGRLNTATGQAADLLQQLKSVQAENASLMSQLALSQGRDTEAVAAHASLQEALEGMRAELKRYCGLYLAVWLNRCSRSEHADSTSTVRHRCHFPRPVQADGTS
jgi:chromosome segregation ATPase